MTKNIIKSTTIIGIRKKNLVVIAGDGQASLGNTIMKGNVLGLQFIEVRYQNKYLIPYLIKVVS